MERRGFEPRTSRLQEGKIAFFPMLSCPVVSVQKAILSLASTGGSPDCSRIAVELQ